MSARTSLALVATRPLDAAAGFFRGAGMVALTGRRSTGVRFGGGWWGTLGDIFARSRINYKAEVGDPSANSAVVAVVGWIARNFPEAPAQISRIPKAEGDKITYIMPSDTGHGRVLQLLEKPNPYYSGVLQWMATMFDYFCTGNAYWIKVRGPSGRVEQLWWAPSWMMEPRWDPNDYRTFILCYEYMLEGRSFLYRPSDIVHFRDGIDPGNVRKGRSRLASLYREIFTDDEASNMTASLMRNLGVPGVIISPANTTGPTARFGDLEEMKANFMEKFGGDRRGEPMINSVPTDVKVLSWSPEQMNMRDLRKIPEERISAVLGVAAIVAGLGAGLDRATFANFGEARKAAYQEAIIPTQRLVAAELEVQLLPDFGDSTGLDLAFDWTKATAMQEAAGDIWTRYQGAATKGLLTRASFKRAVGEPVDDDKDDVYVMANNMLLLKPGEKPPEKVAADPFGGPPGAGKPGDKPTAGSKPAQDEPQEAAA